MGPERRSMIISDKEKRNTAFHEAGHALVGKLMKDCDPVHKVTIIPRGRALGVTQHLPAEDRLSLSADAANDQIAMTMGGRVAEEVIFGQITTGAVQRHPAAHGPRAPDGVRVGHVREARARCTSASARARSSWAATSATPARTTASRPQSTSTPRCARHRDDQLRPRQEGHRREPREAQGARRGAAGARDHRRRRDRHHLLGPEAGAEADVDRRRRRRRRPRPPRSRRGRASSRRRGPFPTRPDRASSPPTRTAGSAPERRPARPDRPNRRRSRLRAGRALTSFIGRCWPRVGFSGASAAFRNRIAADAPEKARKRSGRREGTRGPLRARVGSRSLGASGRRLRVAE